MTYIENEDLTIDIAGTALNMDDSAALNRIPELIESQNKLLEEQNRILTNLIETLKWLK